MTSTISHDERLARDAAASHGDHTRNLTYLTQRPNLRRPDASGEFPLYRPASFGDVDRMARAALEATLVLPTPTPPLDSLPDAVRRPAPSVHAAEPLYPPRPPGYRGARRMVEPKAPRAAVPGWAWLLVLVGASLISQATGAGLAVWAVTR